ncbi:hypothetical protein M2459_001664 [Parabacteroides sp. PF5-5]|uniref:hypothetical protein n=1 Tax=unclassified Parabacteroides TaxID=2649774 RepID=UPI00247575BB|nr:MULTISPECIES: hypothetical protein [unclassified Parabacteroides]MDH6304927.1 hypothetical protein [Parabacteroides sp. PH5-39]MDH6315987.1 hypothetical protein [Parabacteroides sp. PF5-13]MDH6319644.1 hypothetical protein [Parabacteroides sp. PH5-13]MDH6323375.1 hypothetical protein [Parabacteroides sp. PH5-8]MDH6327116.1 hypothetical protein [Parabacteroides sp. PH5-41]
MKKLVLFVVMAFALDGACMADANTDYVHYKRNYGQTYYKGYVSPKELPKAVIKYLDKHYPDYTIMISKRKGNGHYFVKIRFAGNGYHAYHRSLVFDSEGRVIKG